MKQKYDKDMTLEEQAVRGERQSAVLAEIIQELELKNDAALARALETHGPVISKLKSGKLPYSPLYLIATEELMHNHGRFVGWNIVDLKRKLGLPRIGSKK